MNTDIDYTEKLLNFKTITETNDDEIALRYLQDNGWDEGVIINYFIFRKRLKNI